MTIKEKYWYDQRKKYVAEQAGYTFYEFWNTEGRINIIKSIKTTLEVNHGIIFG